MVSRLSLLWWRFRSTKRHSIHEIAPLLETPESDSIVENSLSIMAGKSDPPPKYDTFVSSPIESDDENTIFSERKNPFQDPEVAEHWRLTYEKSQYECRHVFDPSLTWSEEEEKRLIRKLDWRICLWAVRISFTVSFKKRLADKRKCVMFFGLQVDRNNLTQAVSGTFLKDLKLNTNGTIHRSLRIINY